MLEENLGSGWEYATDVLIEDSIDNLQWVARGLGRIEAESDGTTRLRGSTGNPYWYAERLARLPVGFRVDGGPELRHCVAKLGARLVAAVPEETG